MQENPPSGRQDRRKWRPRRPKFSDREHKETTPTMRQETKALPHTTRASSGTNSAAEKHGGNFGEKHQGNIDSAELQNITSQTLRKSNVNSASTSRRNKEFINYSNSDFDTNHNMSSFRAHHNLPPSSDNKINLSMNTYSFYEQSRKYYNDKELSDDLAERCEDEKLLSTGIKLHASFLEQFNAIHIRNRDQVPFYRDFLDEAKLKEKLSQNPQKYVSCVLEMKGSHKAICKPTNTSHKNCVIEIFGRINIGKAFNNDEVLVEILENKRAHETKLCGRVLGVLNRERYRNVKHPVFICTLDEKDNTLARPLCKTIPKIQILHQNITKKQNNLRSWEIEIFHYDERSQILCDPQIIESNPGDQRTCVFLVALINWDSCLSNALGAIIKMIQCGSGVSSALQILDKQYAVPTLYRKNTTDMVESIIRGADNEPNQNDLNGRKDLTEWNTFTVHTNKNLGLERALSIERISDVLKVGVHISDVAAIIKKHTAVDEEAYCRAVTFCSGIKNAMHMLPEPLSLNYCSLLKNKKRLTISVIFHLETNGRPKQMEGKNVEILLSVIRARENFSYDEVQDIITKTESTDAIEKDIKMLHTLAQKIRQIRLGNSMFAMDLFDNEETEDETNLADTHEAHCLVEEFTIMANRKVAQWLYKQYPTCTPIRCQPAPSPDSLNNFLLKNEFIINCMMRLQNRRISDSLQKPSFEILENNAKVKNKKIIISKQLWKEIVKESKESEPKHIPKYIRTDDLHPLQHMIYKYWTAIQENAEYRCSTNAAQQKDNVHFGLEFDIYTHFTSPIRRYFDVIVHRMVHSALSRQTRPYDDSEIEDICKHINKMTKKAKCYEKDCMALQQAYAYSKMPPMLNCFVDRLSDKCITFCSPLLRYLQAVNCQLTFDLLDIDVKPTIHVDKATEWRYVIANWRKRVFDLDFKLVNETTKTEVAKVASDSDHRNNCQTLNPHKDVVIITLQDWAKLLKLAVSGKILELKKTVQRVRLQQGPLGGSDDVTTASSDSQKLEPTKHFSMGFTHGQILKIQMTAESQRGMLVLKPALYNMTNNVNLCLLHTDDPVLYLYDYTAKSTRDKYYNSKKYLQRWLPLILMEAITGAVKGKNSFCINNVPVTFIGNKRGTFLLPLDYCQSNNIEIGPTGMSRDNDDENNVLSYGWLCLKSKVTQQSNPNFNGILASHTTSEIIWIGHATVSRIELKRDDVASKSLLFSFDLHERSAAIPDEFKKADTKFSTEVLKKSDVERRTEHILKQLPASKNTLAEKIALNKPIPDLGPEYLDVANSLKESDMSWPETNDKQQPLPASNIRQQEAIIKALTSRFSLIYGPPGTGKTYIGVKLIYLFNKINEMMSTDGIKRKQVLFCSSSNKSVDRIAKYMLRHMGESCPNFIRVYERSIEEMDYPIPGGTCCSRRSTKDLQGDEELKSVTLHHVIRRTGNRFAEKIVAFDNMFKDPEYLRDSSKVQEYIDLVNEASIQEIANHDVILCTTVVGYSPNVSKETAVNQVIINEAGMCSEPQCMALILAAKAKQVVLIGDHMQLKPSIKCKYAGDLGLEKSLFERYAWTKSARNIQFTMLEQQYRMNPMICDFPSKQFYGSRLVTMLGPWNNDVMSIWPKNNDDTFPHVFVHVEGSEHVVTVSTENGMEQSRSNHAEIEQVVKVYLYLINEGVDQHSINIISQYSAHCDEIKRVLNEQHLVNQNVNTVVSSQGGEWDYIIFSTVRSLPEYKIEKNPNPGWCKHKLGFVTDHNQINVVLTRPRKGLIIIGNKNVLSCDTMWKKLLEHYHQRRCIKTPAEFPPPPRTIQERLADTQKQACKQFDEVYLKTGESTSNKNLYDDDRNSQTSGHVRSSSSRKNVLKDQDRQKFVRDNSRDRQTFVGGYSQDRQTYVDGHNQDRQEIADDHSRDRQEFAGGASRDRQTYVDDHNHDREESADRHSRDRQTFVGGYFQDRQTYVDGHNQDRQEFAGGHSRDRKTYVRGYRQDRQMYVDGHSQDREESADRHSRDRQTFVGGYRQDRRRYVDGHSQDREESADRHSRDRQTFVGGYRQDRRTYVDGHSQDREEFADGHNQDRQEFAGGHSRDRQKFFSGHSRDRQTFVTGYNQDRKTFVGGYGRNQRHVSRRYGRGRRTFSRGHGSESVDNEMEPNDTCWQRVDAEQW